MTDVAAVTGFPEMLDGRVKTLHPRIHGGILADRRLEDHRRQLVAAAIAPFELVVVNLYPFAAAAARPGIELDALVEEIDIGGPSMVRAAAKNHASVAIVTSPARYPAILAAIAEEGSVPAGPAGGAGHRGVRPHGRVRRPDRRGAAAADGGRRRGPAARPGLPGAPDPYPPTLTIALEKVESLRYGENPHQPAARYRRPGERPEAGPFATGEPPLQGKALSYNNVLDASAAAALAGALRGPGCIIVKHTNPCGAAERPTLLEAWEAALAGDPGVGLRWRRRAHPPGRRGGGRRARVDLPRGRRGAGVRAGGAGDPGHEAEPARARPPAARHGTGGRRRRDPPAVAHRRLPDRRWRRPGHRARYRARTIRRPGASSAPGPRPTPSGATSTSPGGCAGA